MADDPSSSVVPWLVVIEQLACFPPVHSSLLHAVLEKASESEFPDDLGKVMRESVSLRLLEELCGPRIAEADKGSLEECRLKLDSSKSCEEVLLLVFPEDSEPDLEEAKKELSKWDIGSFLEHKRASMPLTTLERWKMNGSVGLLASSLKDVAGLAPGNTEGEASGEINEPGLEPNGKDRGDHGVGVRGNVIPTAMEWREYDDARISPSAKRSRTDLAKENHETSLDDLRHGNGSSPADHPNAKKLKQCLLSDVVASDPMIVPDSFNSPLKDSTNMLEDQIGTSKEGQISGADLAKENHEESLDDLRHGNGSSPVDHSNAQKSKQCLPSDAEASDPIIVPDSFNSPPNGSIRTSEEGQISVRRAGKFALQSADSPDGSKNRADVDELQGKVDAISTEKAKIGESTDTASNKETESAQTEFLPARDNIETMSGNIDLHIDVAELYRKKLEFLNRVTAQNVCKKCGEGGQLMACHYSTCPVVVHESCVGLSATFDADCNFCCPFCSFSDARLGYLDSEKEFSMAGQELVAFHNLNHQLNRLHLDLEQLLSVQARDEISNEPENVFPECRREVRDRLAQDNNSNTKGTERDREKSAPSPNMCSEKSNHDFSSRQGSQERENGNTDMTNNKNPELEVQCPDDDAVTNQQDTLVNGMADHTDNAPHPMINAKGKSDNVNKESGHLREKGSEEVCITPIRRRTRQKNVEWTTEQDIILKEGVEKHTYKNGIISWMDVLVFGGDVLKGKTNLDLKNRWNNKLKK